MTLCSMSMFIGVAFRVCDCDEKNAPGIADGVYYPACWWIDKLSLLLAVVTLVHVLYPFVISFHDERHHRRIRFGQVLLLAGLGIVWVVTRAVAWSRVGLPSLASAEPMIAFYVVFFFTYLALCVSLLVYGILLIRKSPKMEVGGTVLRLVLLLGYSFYSVSSVLHSVVMCGLKTCP